MNKIKYGILSTATIAPRFMKGIELSELGHIEAVASRSLEDANKLASQFNVTKVYDNYDSLFADSEIDVIYIPLPNYLHYEYCLKALKAGKHVVCEKPFTLTSSEAIELFSYAKENNLFLMEAQKIVFLPITSWLKQAILDKTIGDIRYINLTSSFPEGKDKTHWMYSNEKGGGVFYGSASYTVEYMQHLFDTTISSYSSEAIIGSTGVDEIGTINMNLNNGIHVTSTISRLVATKQLATFYGTKGRIEVPSFWKTDEAYLYQDGKEMVVIKRPFESEFVYEVNHINECISNKLIESPIMSKEKTLECIKLVEAITKK